jgi:hypothetical protein
MTYIIHVLILYLLLLLLLLFKEEKRKCLDRHDFNYEKKYEYNIIIILSK